MAEHPPIRGSLGLHGTSVGFPRMVVRSTIFVGPFSNPCHLRFRTKMRKPSRGTSPLGVTLLELMVALSLIGVLAGLAIPSFSEMIRRSRARVEVREVRNFLSRAGALARLRRECAKVHLVGNSVLQISLHPKDSTAPAPQPCDFSTTSALPVPSPSRSLNLLEASHTGDLQLDSRGSLLSPSPYELTLTVKDSTEKHRFHVVAGTGSFKRGRS